MDHRLQAVVLIATLGCGSSLMHPVAPVSSEPLRSVAPVTVEPDGGGARKRILDYLQLMIRA